MAKRKYTPGAPTSGGRAAVGGQGSMNSSGNGFGGKKSFGSGTPTPRAGSTNTGRGSMNPTAKATRAATTGIQQPMHPGLVTQDGTNSSRAKRAATGSVQLPPGC